MTARERRKQVLKVLCQRRYDTIDNLAFEFDVSRRTIEYDVQSLSLDYPLYTTQGRGGGVYVVDGFYLGKNYLTDKQVAALRRIAMQVPEADRQVIHTILANFQKPKK